MQRGAIGERIRATAYCGNRGATSAMVRVDAGVSAAWPMARRMVVLGAVVAFCSWWSIAFTRGPAGLSTLWIASGVLGGVLMTSSRRLWPAYLGAAFAAFIAVNVLSASSWPVSLALSSANTLEGFLLAWFLRRYVGDVTDASRIMRVAKVGSVSAVGACMLSAMTTAWVLGASFPGSRGLLFATCFASHCLGLVIFGTLTVVSRAQGKRLLGAPGRRAELALVIVLITLTCIAVFSQTRYPLLFLIYPALLYAVFRHRFSGFVLGTTVIAVIATTQTVSGRGPFMQVPDISALELTLLLQIFIATTCLLALPIAMVLTERSALVKKLVRLARYDPLTGLANRLNFQERLELAIAQHVQKAQPIALLYLDVDHFKQVNDTQGHAAGDTVLCELAQRLSASVRRTDFAARIGGDEFTVLIENVERADVAEMIAQSLIERMRDHIDANGTPLAVTVSIGIAYAHQSVCTADMLMRIADDALYQAKTAGRNTFRVVS